MSKQNIILCLLMACITTTSLIATSQEAETKKPNAPKEKPLKEEERDNMLLLSGIGILGSVISIFIDRHNLSHVKTQLFALLAGIQSFVQVMIRSPHRFETEEELVESLITYLDKQGLL